MNTLPEPGAKKKTAFVIVLLLAPLVLLFGLELASRAAINLIYGVPGKAYGIYRADPVLGHFPAPNTYNHLTSLNDWGFRTAEDVITPKPEGAERVITYGGSTTFCPKLTTEACWSGQLEKRMREGDGNAGHQVLNGGVVLWSLSHVLERAKRDIPKLKPDKVIIYSGFNEGSNSVFLKRAGMPIDRLVDEGRYGVAAANYPASDWFALNSVLFKIARGIVVSGYRQFSPPKGEASFEADAPPATGTGVGSSANEIVSPPPPDPETLKNYLVVLERLITLIRRNGAEPVMLIQSSKEPITGTEFSRIGAKMVCGMGVRALDSREAIASYQGPKDELYSSSIHYSAKGAAVLADYLYDRLYKRKGFSICGDI
ncbi:MAG: hypothetical protein IH994_06780 [Proteobacteria bacterium]|nr:hypothetical protein [Pseudomonadota bacterium]